MKKTGNNQKRGTEVRNKALAAAAAIILTVIALTTCSPMNLQDIAGYVPVYSQVVGPDGGTVTDSRGASVEIPAGALAEETTITIATYADGGDIYSSHGVTPFSGGADFGPDGIQFLKPVTITLPSSRKMVPGQTQPLFMGGSDPRTWEMIDSVLTASEDGWSATAEVTHFTPYVSSLLPPDALSKIEEFFDGTNGQVALGSYMAWFLTATDLYGYTTECGNSVYEVVGLFFDFTWQVDGNTGTAVSQYGDVSMDTVAQLSYAYDTASTDGPEYTYSMLITVYFDVTENPPEAEPNISILEPLPGSTVEGIETISTYINTGDSDIDIESVSFYANGTLLGSDTEAPFQWYWDTDSLADGEHTLTVTAAFSNGESVESEEVTVTVGDGEEGVPVPGNEGLLSITPNNGHILDLQWTSASDNNTAAANLEYKVVRSENDDLRTLTAALAADDITMDWSTAVTSCTINASVIGTNYYYTVLVRDRDLKAALYSQTLAPIVYSADSSMTYATYRTYNSASSGTITFTPENLIYSSDPDYWQYSYNPATGYYAAISPSDNTFIYQRLLFFDTGNYYSKCYDTPVGELALINDFVHTHTWITSTPSEFDYAIYLYSDGTILGTSTHDGETTVEFSGIWSDLGNNYMRMQKLTPETGTPFDKPIVWIQKDSQFYISNDLYQKCE